MSLPYLLDFFDLFIFGGEGACKLMQLSIIGVLYNMVIK